MAKHYRKTCDLCRQAPCETVKSARAMLGAWARERRRQMGDEAPDINKPVPDKDAMADALPELKPKTCPCPCHT